MIVGEKIYLRPIEEKDVYVLNKWKNDEKVFKWLGGGFQPVSVDQQINWMDNMIDMTGNNRRFIICDKSDQPIGSLGLYGINWIHQTAEVGLYIGEIKEQGKGFASEAYNLLETYSKNYLNMRKLKLYVVKNNEVAEHLWTKLGFSIAGVLSKERYINGNYYDLVIMEKFIS